MSNPGDRLPPLEQIATDFVQRFRQGEHPSVEQYAAQYPQWAEEILREFPALVMEQRLRAAEAQARLLFGDDRRIADYRILREIGRGGMGIVFEAEHASLARRVALKILLNVSLLSPEGVRRFRREAQAAARLHHTNIVPVFDVGEEHGLPYYVMQYIDGQSLDEVLRQWTGRAAESTDSWIAVTTRGLRQSDEVRAAYGNAVEDASNPAWLFAGDFQDASTAEVMLRAFVPPRCQERHEIACHAAAQIGIQVARALEYAHSQGILHRDVKPANILLDHFGTAWITDFGLAKLADDELTRSSAVMGTLRYMAPEQFEGTYDCRSDVYALGLTLYEVVAGRPVFQESEYNQLVRQVTQDAPPRLRSLNGTVPRDLETIISKAMARSPQHRYQTAGDLASDLQRFIDGRPIRARQISSAERLWRWSRRNPALASLSAIALALLLAVAAVASWGYVRTQQMLVRVDEQRTEAERQRAESHGNLVAALDALDEIFEAISARGMPQSVEVEVDGDEVVSASSSVLTEEDAELLQSLLKFFGRFANEDGEGVFVRTQTALSLRRLAGIRSRLGQFSAADETYRQAIRSYQALVDAFPGQADYALGLAKTCNELASVYARQRRFADALDMHSQAQRVLEEVLAQSPHSAPHRFELALTHMFLGSTPIRPADASRKIGGQRPVEDTRRKHHEDALRILDSLREEAPGNTTYQLATARCYRSLAAIWWQNKGQAKRTELTNNAIGVLSKLVKERPKVAEYRYELATTLLVSRAGFARDGSSEAAQRLAQAVGIGKELAARFPHVPEYQSLYANALTAWAFSQQAAGETEHAKENFSQAVARLESLVEAYPTVVVNHIYLARTSEGLAKLLQASGQLERSLAVQRKVIARCEAFAGSDKENPLMAFTLLRLYRNLADTLRKQGDETAANEAAERASKLWRSLPRGRTSGGKRDASKP